jgi:superfamily I DNA/RNA helicase
VVDFIIGLFKDVGTAREDTVTCSSVHKAKGLEADRVWVLRPDLMPFPKARPGEEMLQEENLKYVAYTRVKQELRTVRPPEEKRQGNVDAEYAPHAQDSLEAYWPDDADRGAV